LTYVAIGLAFSHQFANGTDFAYHPAVRASWTALYVGVAAAVCYARVARPLLDAARHRLVVTDVVAEGGGAVSITVGGRDLDRLHAQSGQFFRLRFLTRGRWRQAHPFSLSAAPTPERFRFTVKPVGDHTRALRALAPGTRVLAAGPFGSLTAQRRRKPKVLLIAGGIGITPLRALLESLPGEAGDVTLIYRCRSEAEAPLRGELDELARQRGATVRYVVGPRSDDGCRLDGRLLAGLVGGLSEHDVYLCAPPALATSVTAVLRGAGVPARNIHRESFELGTSPRGRLRHTAATSLGLAALAAAFAARTDAAGHATQSGPAGLAAAPQGASPSGRSLPGNTGEVVVPGSLQRTLYTTVQVAAVLRDGRLVDVRALALPNLDARSRQISAVAAPVLRREAISAGSADIDMVSGATFTSAAYARSLQAALDSRPPR
jgi:ferredoxin-NADP reductase